MQGFMVTATNGAASFSLDYGVCGYTVYTSIYKYAFMRDSADAEAYARKLSREFKDSVVCVDMEAQRSGCHPIARYLGGKKYNG